MLSLQLSVYSGSDFPQWHVKLGSLFLHEQLGLTQLASEDLICDLKILQLTTEEAGVYPLISCCCGSPLCEAYHVEVLHKGDRIYWQRVYKDESGAIGAPLKNLKWGFRVSEYRATIEKALLIAEYVELNQILGEQGGASNTDR